MSANLRYDATVTFNRRPLPRASRPFIGSILKGSKGSIFFENVGKLRCCEHPASARIVLSPQQRLREGRTQKDRSLL
jgi:hypothetical protein